MQMTEQYVLSVKVSVSTVWGVIGTYDTEGEAVQDMELDALHSNGGSWKIDRVMTVTVHTASKARV